MTPPGDPYRVLGLAPGASLDDVKHAYRRLAKASHPDSAGPTATARFIALQQAYEALLRIAPVGPRRTPTTARPTRRPAPGARPRARTTSTGSSSTPPPRGASPRGAAPPKDGSSPKSARSDPGEASTRRRNARRATLGTTTYDDLEPNRPTDWQGASWYGVSTGTYWTINPKEYADPRKHGPEYLARGRRQPSDADGEQATAVREPAAPIANDRGEPVIPPRPRNLLRRIVDRARRG